LRAFISSVTSGLVPGFVHHVLFKIHVCTYLILKHIYGFKTSFIDELEIYDVEHAPWNTDKYPPGHPPFTEMCSGSEAGSYLRLIDGYITQLKAQGPCRTCNESKEEEEEGHPPVPFKRRGNTSAVLTICT